MKLFVKLMVAILVIGMLLPFTILKDDDGDTLASFSDFSLPDFSMPGFSMPKMPRFSEPSIEPASDDDLTGKDLFYKWYDADGNVQFTTEPPADGVEFTIKGFDHDANVIQAVKVPPKTTAPKEPTLTQQKPSVADESENPYTQDSIKKLFEDTRNIEKLLNQRLSNQNSGINQ